MYREFTKEHDIKYIQTDESPTRGEVGMSFAGTKLCDKLEPEYRKILIYVLDKNNNNKKPKVGDYTLHRNSSYGLYLSKIIGVDYKNDSIEIEPHPIYKTQKRADNIKIINPIIEISQFMGVVITDNDPKTELPKLNKRFLSNWKHNIDKVSVVYTEQGLCNCSCHNSGMSIIHFMACCHPEENLKLNEFNEVYTLPIKQNWDLNELNVILDDVFKEGMRFQKNMIPTEIYQIALEEWKLNNL